MEKKFKKVALAYSGGLDTSIIIPWLKDHYGCEVIAICGNCGQSDELEGLEEKAIKTSLTFSLGDKIWFYALNLPLMILLGAFINTPTEVSMNSFVYIGSSSRMSFLMNSING